MQTAQGNLTILNAHTATPSVYWNGHLLSGLQRVHVQCDEDGGSVKIVVNGTEDAIYDDMQYAGIKVKKVSDK
jgi:hypothetical protein